MIIDFIDKEEIDGNDKKAIARIIKEGFWGKMGNFFRKVNSDEAVNILEQSITFDKGYYYKDKGIVLGVALLATKNTPYIHFDRQARKSMGFWDAMALQIGFASIKPKRDDGLKLEMLAVGPEARGKGIGTKMLDHLNHIAMEDSFERITLEVIDSNGKAKKLYERAGYKSIKYTNTALFTRDMGFRGLYKMQKDIRKKD